jgi:hypothetical protein
VVGRAGVKYYRVGAVNIAQQPTQVPLPSGDIQHDLAAQIAVRRCYKAPEGEDAISTCDLLYVGIDVGYGGRCMCGRIHHGTIAVGGSHRALSQDQCCGNGFLCCSGRRGILAGLPGEMVPPAAEVPVVHTGSGLDASECAAEGLDRELPRDIAYIQQTTPVHMSSKPSHSSCRAIPERREARREEGNGEGGHGAVPRSHTLIGP